MQKADIVHRAIAKAIDLVIVGMLAYLLPSIFGVLSAGLYILISDGFFHGQSVGKKLTRIKVVLTDPEKSGKICTFRQSLIRNAPYAVVIVFGFIPFIGWFIIFPLGVLFLVVETYFAYSDDQGIRMGDIYAGTQVVDEGV